MRAARIARSALPPAWRPGLAAARALTRSVLTVAGSDSAGAAGVQADLRTFDRLGCRGLVALTAVTAQSSRHVARVHPLPARVVREQIEAALFDTRAAAVKTGMLGSAEIVRAVARALGRLRVPLVVDPVLRASSGRRLTAAKAVPLLRERLLPLATLVTPNLPEAEALLARPIRSRAQREAAALALLELGPRAVLIKGGHTPEPSKDVLAYRERGRTRIRWLAVPRVRTLHTRGTGCVLSAACACFLAQGLSVPEAVARAKAFLTRALRAGARPTRKRLAVRKETS